MELVLIIVAIVILVMFSYQYAVLKKIDNIQITLDKLNQNLENINSREKNDLH